MTKLSKTVFPLSKVFQQFSYKPIFLNRVGKFYSKYIQILRWKAKLLNIKFWCSKRHSSNNNNTKNRKKERKKENPNVADSQNVGSVFWRNILLTNHQHP